VYTVEEVGMFAVAVVAKQPGTKLPTSTQEVQVHTNPDFPTLAIVLATELTKVNSVFKESAPGLDIIPFGKWIDIRDLVDLNRLFRDVDERLIQH